jgi:hypothetical protein
VRDEIRSVRADAIARSTTWVLPRQPAHDDLCDQRSPVVSCRSTPVAHSAHVRSITNAQTKTHLWYQKIEIVDVQLDAQIARKLGASRARPPRSARVDRLGVQKEQFEIRHVVGNNGHAHVCVVYVITTTSRTAQHSPATRTATVRSTYATLLVCARSSPITTPRGTAASSSSSFCALSTRCCKGKGTRHTHTTQLTHL